MTADKKDKFSGRHVTLAGMARAIGHPARLRILELLACRHSCVCGDIVDQLPLAQSTVSQHLSELKRVGLIKGEIEGPRVCYCLDQATLRRFRAAVVELFDELETHPSPEGGWVIRDQQQTG